MYSAYNLNKQNVLVLPILNQSIVPCPLLIASWPTYRFLRRQVRWSGYRHLFKNFPVCCNPHSQRLSCSRCSRGRYFSRTPFFLYDTTNVGNLISVSFASLKPSWYMWKFLVYIMLKPSFKDFEHNLVSMWNEHNCMVVWSFVGIAILWDWNENWPFPVFSCCPCWVLQIYWHIKCSTLTASSFRIWNSLHAISSSPLSLFIAMLPKANFTLQNVWLCVSDRTIMVIQVIRPFLYSSVYSCHLFLILPASVKSFLFLPLMCPYFHEMFSWYRQYSWRDS